jgi:predicted helicase
MPTSMQDYLREIESAYAAGNATEHTYRPALKTLVESFGKNVRATNEPKRVACGAPDFIIAQPEIPVGFIECKDVGGSLDEVEKTDQLKRYFASLENLVLTDYLEFRYYIRGEQKMHVTLARIDSKGRVRSMQGADEQLAMLFGAFLAAKPVTITTPKELAGRMANVAKVIRDAIEKAFALEGEAGTLHGEYESFRATILSDITTAQFADMYAQTVCYGMFSARVNVPDQKAGTFTREHAAYDLPKTNPFLRDVFDYIAGTKLDPSIVWAVDLLAEMMRRCDMGEILKDFGKATRQEDPVVHFYETFLAAYDPRLRESRGVYYTPEPVVSYIVRSIDAILKRDFACPAGLADSSKITVELPDTTKKGGKAKQEVHRVQILDPATGTGTFLYQTIRHIEKALSSNRGSWAGARGYVAQHLLPRVYGFELMMAPYAVAHMKLGWLLKETGYDFPGNERLRVYLTNTLEEAEIVAGPLLALASQIAREANAAGKVKTDCPIMVVMGNPPYSGLSENMNPWVDGLLKKPLPLKGGAESYYQVDGKPLGEKKVWLQDDYVKFIRFAQYRIELTGYGVLGFVTNHGYLDNPTFRGMRQSLMQTFDEIHVLDLHGNSKKKEKPPGGGKDENVFDIQQGVAIGIFVKRKNGGAKTPAKVFKSELWGSREAKYKWLLANDVHSTRWSTPKPDSPHYFFIPKDAKIRKEYEAWAGIDEIFAQNVTGIVTARDEFAIDFEDKPLLDRIYALRNTHLSDSDIRDSFFLNKGSEKYPPGDTRGWKLPNARRTVQQDPDWKKRCADILYRPFDLRRIYFAPWIVDWARLDLMPTMQAGENLALCTARSIEIGRGWEHVFCSRSIIQHHTVSLKEVNYLFPMYLYNGKVKNYGPAAAWPTGKDGRRPNLTPSFVEAFAGKLGLEFVPDGKGDLQKTFGPEDVFHYAYAIFHSPTYRKRYAAFLKVSFPRLPFTGDKVLFARLCRLGDEQTGLHLLEKVPAPAARYPIQGDNLVQRVDYKPPTSESPGRVSINDRQYFNNIPPEVFAFHVGGYQVCEKWLKDRKGRALSYEDIERYRQVTEAVRQTLRVMEEIDRAIPGWPLT